MLARAGSSSTRSKSSGACIYERTEDAARIFGDELGGLMTTANAARKAPPGAGLACAEPGPRNCALGPGSPQSPSLRCRVAAYQPYRELLRRGPLPAERGGAAVVSGPATMCGESASGEIHQQSRPLCRCSGGQMRRASRRVAVNHAEHEVRKCSGSRRGESCRRARALSRQRAWRSAWRSSARSPGSSWCRGAPAADVVWSARAKSRPALDPEGARRRRRTEQSGWAPSQRCNAGSPSSGFQLLRAGGDDLRATRRRRLAC